jgi:hypothetical protein
MKCIQARPDPALTVAVLLAAAGAVAGQGPGAPSVRLVSAPRLTMPGAVDSNNPIVRDLVDGEPQVFVMTSWGGAPSLSIGPALDRLPPAQPVAFEPHPGHGVWMESVIVADDGTWYGYYHNEWPADACGRSDRFIPRLGAARSRDRGRTWQPLGVILEMPAESRACDSTNRFVLGGVGDVSVVLDADAKDLYFYFSQYVRDRQSQGIGAGRLAWADRDEPTGRLSVWQQGAWIPPLRRESSADDEAVSWEYPVATALVAPTRPWHDGNAAADAYWGPAVHWNTYLNQYVMLMNRARDESFNADGIYVAFASSLDDPAAWSAPRKIMNGGGWYVQVAGLEADGTDRQAGQRARFFNTGRSDFFIEFGR